MIEFGNDSENDDYRVVDLLKSDFREEQELAKKATVAMNSIIEYLKPILHYVTVPRPSLRGSTEPCSGISPGLAKHKIKRMIEIIHEKQEGASQILLLNEDGKFILAEECKKDSSSPPHEHVKVIGLERSGWEFFPFEKTIEILRDCLKKETEKQAIRYRSIRQRIAKLDKIIHLLQQPIKLDS